MTPGGVAQSITCLTRCVFDCRLRGCLINPGPAPYFREIISTVILLPLIQSRRVVVSLYNTSESMWTKHFIKLAHEKNCG